MSDGRERKTPYRRKAAGGAFRKGLGEGGRERADEKDLSANEIMV